MSQVPEIRVFSPQSRDSSNEKTVFSWHTSTSKLETSHPQFVKNDPKPLRFFGTSGKSVNLYIKNDSPDSFDAPQPLSLVKWENTFNMRSYNLNNFPTSTTSYRTAYRSQAAAMQRARLGFVPGTARSLELLRLNIQRFINREIDEIIQKYVDKFFKPGIENIKMNNGENSVTDQHLPSVCRQILEEAKKMYQSPSNLGTSPAETTDAENSASNDQKPVSTTNTLKPYAKKRKESDTDSEASFIPLKPKKRKGRPPNIVSGRGTPMKFKAEQVKREGPKWDPARLKSDSLFIMGAKANKALGLGATRGRLYIKHPEVFKYSGDQEDKQWLYDQNLMPATGGKAYMLLVEDIKELLESEEYCNNTALLPGEIVGFTVSETMISKMKEFMRNMRTDAHVKKRGRPASSNNSSHVDIKLEDLTSDEKHGSGTVSPTDELEQFSSEMRSADPSPFSLGTGFEDVSPAQPEISPAASDMSASYEPPLSAPFDISSTP